MKKGKYQKKKRKSFTLPILIVALILACSATVFFVWHTVVDGNKNSPAIVAPNVESAIEQLAQLGAEYGYSNALSELTELNTSELDGDTFYRLQQNYQGIPVYGRSVVCVTDEHGKQVALSGNPQDITIDIPTIPTLSWERISDVVKDYIYNSLHPDGTPAIALYDEGLCIYCLDNETEMRLAYKVVCNLFSETLEAYTLIVDAESGEILSSQSLLSTADTSNSEKVNRTGYLFEKFGESSTVESYKDSDTRRENGFHSERYAEDFYLLEDVPRGLVVRNFCGVESTISQDGQKINLFPSNSSEDLSDSMSKIFISSNNIFGDEEESLLEYEAAAEYMINISKIYDKYETLLETTHHSMTGRIMLYFNDGYMGGENARGGRINRDGMISMGAKTGIDDIDIMAHEYGHVIMYANLMEKKDCVETNAIAEGFADVMGEIVEGTLNNGVLDWTMKGDHINTCRNIKSPQNTDNAVTISEITEEMENKSNDYGYYFSTIISHAAYRMWNGIDGNNAKKLSTDELAKLFYRTMLMMPSDCNFMEWRSLTLIAARSMGLTPDQIACISEAYEIVGIVDNTSVDYMVQENTWLSVYQKDGTLCNDYDIQILSIVESDKHGNMLQDAATYSIKVRPILDDTGNRFGLEFEKGKRYTITLSSGDNTQMADVRFTVRVGDGVLKDNLDIFTDAISLETEENSHAYPTSIAIFSGENISEEYFFTYNELNQVSNVAAYRYEGGQKLVWYNESFTFDAQGNVVLVEHQGEQTFTYSYQYDVDNRMTDCWSKEFYNGIEGPSEHTLFEYDPQGRVSKLKTDTNGASEMTLSYDDSGKIVYETGGGNYGDMSFSTKAQYDYSNYPVVLQRNITSYTGMGESETISISFMPTWNLSLASAVLEVGYSLDYNDNGDLACVYDRRGNKLYSCNYQEYDNADIAIYQTIAPVKYEDEITGTYLAEYEDVKISIDAENDSEYFLTYTASGITLEKIPLAYFNANTSTEKILMFSIDECYPQYSGYVEIYWTTDSISPYSYNAHIDGLEDTEGYYSTLIKTGVFTPAS